jgi:hypothetical protein
MIEKRHMVLRTKVPGHLSGIQDYAVSGTLIREDEMQTVVFGEVLEILDVEGGQRELVR